MALLDVTNGSGMWEAGSYLNESSKVEAKQLALGLKAASEELKAKIMGTMSQRAVAALKEEMEFMGPVKMRDLEAAQSAIVTQVRECAHQLVRLTAHAHSHRCLQ